MVEQPLVLAVNSVAGGGLGHTPTAECELRVVCLALPELIRLPPDFISENIMLPILRPRVLVFVVWSYYVAKYEFPLVLEY